MEKILLSSRKIDYARIILFIPIAWIAYNISANLIIKISTKTLVENIGVNTWRYGFDFFQLLVFMIAGTFVAPRVVRFLSGVLTLLIYFVSYFYSIFVTPILLDISLNEGSFLQWSILSYSGRVVMTLIAIIIVMYQFKKSYKYQNSNG